MEGCYMPYINIDEEEFEVGRWCDIKENWDKFVEFTNNLLLFHRNSILLDKFQIYAHGHDFRREQVERWIRLGIKYCHSMLEIVIPSCSPELFTLPHPGPCLSRLKRLNLYGVEMDSCYAEVLHSGCPVLVHLELDSCSIGVPVIASTTLKKLVIENCSLGGRDSMVIRTPCLLFLKSVIHHGILVRNAASLVKASVCLEVEDLPAEKIRRLLDGLCNVTTLELCNFKTMAMLHENSDKFSLFPNMRALSLNLCLLDDEFDLDSRFEDLGSFLENAPCLEKLTLFHTLLEQDIIRKSISLQAQDGKTFRCPKLKLIEFNYDCHRGSLPLELLWRFARRLPDAKIVLTKI